MATDLRTSTALRKLRFDGGSLVLNLTATVGRRGAGEEHRVERLDGEEALEQWLVGVGIEVDASVDRGALLTELRELREDAWEVLSGVVHERPSSSFAVQRIERWASADVPPPRLANTLHGPQARMVALSQSATCARAARDLLDILASPDVRHRLRECASEECRMIYVLPSGSRERRWCSMSQCGNRAKAAAHRARSRQPRERTADVDVTDDRSIKELGR